MAIAAVQTWASIEQPQGKSWIVVGRVLDGSTTTPLAGAAVSCGGKTAAVISGVRGEFALTIDASTRCNLKATKAGLLGGAYGQWRPYDAAAVFEYDARQKTVALRLWKPAVIEGRILDDSDEPIVHAPVIAMASDPFAGSARFNTIGVPAARTDDRGTYRLSGLAAGRYVVAAVAPDAWSGQLGSDLAPFPTTYFPAGRTVRQASVVEIAAGETRHGIDIVVPADTELRILRGIVTTVSTPASGWIVELSPATDELTAVDVRVATTRADGTFSFPDVPLGAYRLQAYRPSTYSNVLLLRPGVTTWIPRPAGYVETAQSREPMWASREISLEPGNGTHVSLEALRGYRICGRVLPTGSVDAPSTSVLPQMAIVPVRVNEVEFQRTSTSQPGTNGAFCTPDLPAGRYGFRLHSPGGWRLESVTEGMRATRDGRVELDADVENINLMVTTRPAEVSGVVTDADGTASPGARVVVIAPGTQSWRDGRALPATLGWSRADEFGRYQVSGTFSGQYSLCAVAHASEDRLLPILLDGQRSFCSSVELRSGSRVMADIRVFK